MPEAGKLAEFICIGTILKPHGVKGEVKILPFTDDVARFAALDAVYIKENGGYSKKTVAAARFDSSFAYVKLAETRGMNDAEALRGVDVFVDRKNAIKLPKGRWFIADLIGCLVSDSNGNEIGVLKDVLQAGGNDVYSISGKQSCLFPAIKELLLEVDVENKRILVDAARLKEVAVYED